LIGLAIGWGNCCVASTISAGVGSSNSSLARSRAESVAAGDRESTMLRREFQPNSPLRCVAYLRMSDPGQNARSPDQQRETIESTVRRKGYPWRTLKHYRDDGMSGRLKRRRPGYNRMLADIKSGAVKVDVILVDSIERFGRHNELPEIRRKLREQFGVLVLSADTDFADPTTPMGEVHAVFENVRASEAGRIKAHDVRRGKRDTIERGYWPGGPPPFGYKLQLADTEKRKGREIRHHILVPDEETAWILQRAFALADGPDAPGQTRIAKRLNEDSEIPERFKPFHAETVGVRLDNSIYVGEITWDANSTDLIDDTRIVEPNPEDMILRKAGFCEPLIDRAVWDRVQARRCVRSERLTAALARNAAEEKCIAPMAAGLTLRYLLTGLVRCGECGRSMTPSSGRAYVAKNGEARRYVTYVCPASLAGACLNRTRVKEPWLREQALAAIVSRLFPRKSA
jgi:DNA invertase Pin-like site-specific DNA recombinase